MALAIAHRVPTPLEAARSAAAARLDLEAYQRRVARRGDFAGHGFRHQPGSVAPAWSFIPPHQRRAGGVAVPWRVRKDLPRDLTVAQRIAVILACPPPALVGV